MVIGTSINYATSISILPIKTLILKGKVRKPQLEPLCPFPSKFHWRFVFPNNKDLCCSMVTPLRHTTTKHSKGKTLSSGTKHIWWNWCLGNVVANGFIELGDMKSRVQQGIKWKLKFVSHRTNLLNNLVRPKILRCRLLVGTSLHRVLAIRAKFKEHLIPNCKGSVCAIFVSLGSHSILGTLQMVPQKLDLCFSIPQFHVHRSNWGIF